MTPRSFRFLLDRLRDENRAEMYRALLPTLAVYNVNRDPEKGEFLTPEKFLSDGKPKRKKHQTVEDMLIMGRIINEAFGGTDYTRRD